MHNNNTKKKKKISGGSLDNAASLLCVCMKISPGLNIYKHNTAVTANITSALEGSVPINCPSVESRHQNPACRSTFLHWITKMVSPPV